MIDLTRVRADLPSATAAAYMNAGTFGPVPRASAEAMAAHQARAFADGRISPTAFASMIENMDAARAAFATVACASPETIALTHSTTEGINLVVSGIDWAPGDEIVTTSHEHPGITEPLFQLARRFGTVTRVVEPTRDAIAAALGPRTRLVAISHVLWTTGDVLPLPGIAEDAHAAGAALLVDGAQSGGAIAIDPAASGADYYTISGQKWLCGPSGTGALWVRPERLGELATAWPWYLSRDRHSGPVAEWEGARRLDAGTITMTALAGLVAAVAWRGEVGWDDAFAASHALAGEARTALDALPGVEVVGATAPSTLIAFAVPGRDPVAVVASAARAGVLVRAIPGFNTIRASIGFWNDRGDVDRLLDAVRG
jgi:L-cysteine/cystine lyase